MARIGVEAQFRVISMAERDLARVVGAFSPAFGRLGVFMSRFTRVAGVGFASLGATGAAAAGLIFAGFLALQALFRILSSLLNKFLSLLKDVVKEGVAFQNSMILIGVATNSLASDFVGLATSLPLIGVSSREAAKGLEVLVRAGFDAKEAMAVFPELAMFSRAVGASMGRTASILVGAVRAFNIEAENSRRVLDTMAFAILRTRFNFETFSTAFAFGGAAAAGFGQDLEETVGVMAKFFDLGLRASTVGTTIRNMLSRLGKPTKEARAALLQYGITLKGVNPLLNNWGVLLKRLVPLLQDAESFTTIFGRRTGGFIRRLVQQIAEGKVNIEDFTNTIKNSTGIIRKVMMERLNAASGQLEAFGAQWQTFKVEIFNAIEPIIKEAMFELNKAMLDVRDAFQSMMPAMRVWGNIFSDVVIGSFEHARKVVRGFIGIWDYGTGLVEKAIKMVISSISDLGTASENFSAYITDPIKYMSEAVGISGMKFSNTANKIKDTSNAAALLGVWLKSLKTRWNGSEEAMGSFVEEVINTGLEFSTLKARAGRSLKGITKLLDEQTKLMITKFKASMKELNENFGVSKRTQARLSKDITATIIALANLIERKDVGGLIDKMNKLGEEMGVDLANTLLQTARESLVTKDLGKEVVAGVAISIKQQQEKLGRLSLMKPATIKKMFKNAKVVIQEEIFDILKGVGESKVQEKLVGSIAGFDISPRMKRQAIANLQNIFTDVFAVVNRIKREAAEEGGDFLGISRADEAQLLGAFQVAANQLTIRLKELKGTFNSLDTAVAALKKTWMPLNEDVAKKFLERINEMRESGEVAPKAIMAIVKSMTAMGKASAKAVKVIEKVPPALRDFFKEQLQLNKALSDPSGLERTRKAVVLTAKDFNKAMTELKGLNRELWEGAMKNLPALAESMTREEFAEYLVYIEKLNQGIRDHNRLVAEQKKFLKKNMSLEREYYELTVKKFVPGKLDATTQAAIKRASIEEKEMRKVIKAEEVLQSQRDLMLKHYVARLGRTYGQAFMAFRSFVQSTSASIARSLVDSTFKFKDAFKSAINEMKAKLLELMVIQPILGGIFDAFVPGSSLLFFQHGTSLRGVPGPSGRDKVPAMLTAEEIVLDKNASDVVRAMASGSIGGGNTLYMKVDIHALDGADVKKVMRNSITPMLNRQLRTNQGIAPDVKIRAGKTTFQKGFR